MRRRERHYLEGERNAIRERREGERNKKSITCFVSLMAGGGHVVGFGPSRRAGGS